jgi:type IV secretory pathway TraG/TraD family ATPase VirD4
LCWQLLLEGHARPKGQWEQYDYDATASFWLKEYPSLAQETRSSIVSMFTSMADNLLRRPFRMIFSEPPGEGDAIAFPELSHHGVVIIMNLPVKEFGDAGRAAQVVYKYMWQQAAERRDTKANPRPVFLWVDEAQNFATEYDMQFQATARSSRACTVYLTQNLPNYYAEMGGEGSKHRVDSLVGNLQTKIWHANSDPETNKHAAETIGHRWQIRRSQSQSFGGNSINIGDSQQESFDFDVPPQEFTKLAKGGPPNDFEVGAIVFQNGRVWSNGLTYLPVTFNQSKR